MKKYFPIYVVLVGLLVHGCMYPQKPPPPPQPQPFTVRIEADKTVYRVGETIAFTVQVNRDCYLTLYDISTEGEVTQIFPNRYTSHNFLEANKVYRIPEAADPFEFEVLGPAGLERVRAVATVENVNFFEDSKTRDQDEVFPRIQQSPPQFNQNLDRKLHVIPTERWTEASFTIQIVE